jgi:O-antigen ligase
LYAFYGLGVIFVGGGFVLYTAGADPRVAREIAAASPVSQLVLGFFYLGGALLLVSSPQARRVLRFAWPMLLLPGLAIVSTLWSPDPALTLRRAVAFAGTIIFGLSLGAAFRFRGTVTLIAFAMSIVMVVSVALAVLDPVRAIHQPDDVIQAVHAGHWRGIFAHRNTLGFWAGASIVVLGLVGGEAFRRPWLWPGTVLAAAACLVATGSSAGLAIVAFAAAFFMMLTTTLKQPAQLRAPLAVFWAVLGLAAVLSFEEIARFGLQLLGRDSNLTGRTELWSYLLELVRDADKPLGLGYFVGTLLLDQRLADAMQIRNVNAHNGYLEAYVYFGWLGVVVAAVVAVWLLYEATRFAAMSHAKIGYLAAVPAVMVFICLVHNLVESTIVSPNNLNNVLLSAVAAIVVRGRIAEKL